MAPAVRLFRLAGDLLNRLDNPMFSRLVVEQLWYYMCRKSLHGHRVTREVLMARLEDYAVVTRPDDNGTFVAYVPAIDGCHALGRTPGEAQSELRHVFEMLQEE